MNSALNVDDDILSLAAQPAAGETWDLDNTKQNYSTTVPYDPYL
jgi:hypothetical protein